MGVRGRLCAFFCAVSRRGIYIETDSELVRPINELIEYNGFLDLEEN